MNLNISIGFIAGVLSLISWIIYDIGILRKKTRPNRATWSILTVLGILIAFSYYDSGARETAWVAVAYVVGSLSNAILAIFYYGEGGWTPFDRKCITLVIICFILWVLLKIFFDNVSLPILIISLVIDFVAILPTIKKSFLEPRFENAYAWFFESLSCIINLFAVSVWAFSLNSFAVWVYPVYLAVANSIITLVIIVGNYKLRSRIQD